MDDSIFEEGGQFNIERVGAHKFLMRTSLPPDADGLVGSDCPSNMCSPGYFKVKPGTGITGEQFKAYCPYCRQEGEPGNFLSEAQIEYAKQVVLHEAMKGISDSIQNALGLGPSGRKSYGSGMFSIEMSYKPGTLPPVIPPMEEILRRDITCPHCGLEHSVFGLATWCPDCGQDIFIIHITKEFETIRKTLSDVGRRRELLGLRVATRDVENALEDIVSIFEAAMRAMTRRKMKEMGFLGISVKSATCSG